MTTKEGEKLHHLFGSSTAKIWSNCYGWAALTEQANQQRIDAGLPPEAPGEAADIGTASHIAILERRFVSEIDHLRNGTPINTKYDDIPNIPEDVSEEAEEFTSTIMEELLEGIVTGKQIYIEKKLMYDESQDAGGTADLVAIYLNDKAEVVLAVADLKTGRVQVEADSEQNLFLLAAAFKKLENTKFKPSHFVSAIYQTTSTPKFKKHVFTKSDVAKAIKRYDKALVEAKKEKPKFKVGSWCEYCKVKARCKEFAKHVDETMEMKVALAGKLPQVEELDDEQLRKIFLFGDVVEDYLKAVRVHAMKRFTIGRPIPGLKVVEGRSNRAWVNPEQAITVLEAHGLEASVKKIKGLGEIEKLLKASGKSKLEIAEIMASLTAKPPAKHKVTSVDDPRPEVIVNSAQLLDELDKAEEEFEDRSDF